MNFFYHIVRRSRELLIVLTPFVTIVSDQKNKKEFNIQSPNNDSPVIIRRVIMTSQSKYGSNFDSPSHFQAATYDSPCNKKTPHDFTLQ